MEVARAAHVLVRDRNRFFFLERDRFATELEDLLDRFVAARTEAERLSARRFESRVPILLRESLETLRQAPSLLAHRICIEQSAYERTRQRPPRLAPRLDRVAAREVVPMRLGHVRGV